VFDDRKIFVSLATDGESDGAESAESDNPDENPASDSHPAFSNFSLLRSIFS
jgi:hypothetical protein